MRQKYKWIILMVPNGTPLGYLCTVNICILSWRGLFYLYLYAPLLYLLQNPASLFISNSFSAFDASEMFTSSSSWKSSLSFWVPSIGFCGHHSLGISQTLWCIVGVVFAWECNFITGVKSNHVLKFHVFKGKIIPWTCLRDLSSRGMEYGIWMRTM